ncbi:MAG: NADH-quinone oxidoreductase subunit N [Planctomycetes bacterium]|nr:NADH-quinone oxidoreductase subunit N [Planctomycetota bacterium]
MTPDFLRQLVNETTLFALAPFLVLCAGAMLLLLADIVPGAKGLRAPLFVASIAVASFFEVRLFDHPTLELFSNSFVSSPKTAFWGLLFLSSALIAWCFAQRYYDEEKGFLAEHDVLFLCSTAGMMLMAGAQDLLTFFVGLELLSVPLYTLAGFRRTRNDSVEAGLKYFVLGAFAAAIFLYGAALLYTDTGTISLAEMRAHGAGTPLALLGVALIAGSLFFKVSVFPFHLWVPDVYQGSPTPVTALMATGTKAAGFAFLLNAAFLLPKSAATTVAVIALATMAAGNLGALVQTDLKRMLAYSGIAHAGVLLLAVAGGLAGDPQASGALNAALFYMAAYVFTAGGAFGLVAWLERETDGPVTLESLRGLAARRPAIAAALALFMLSLGGIPATGGFLGKYLVFSVAVRADMIAVAVFGVLMSVVALGYYLRVVVALYMQKPAVEASRASEPHLPATLATGVCAAMVLLLGLAPGWFLARLV